MAGKKTITNLSELTSAASNDVLPVVDVSDQSVTSSGETKKITVTNLLSGKADSSHTHAISDVTNLQTSLDAKQATVTAGDGLSFSGDTLNAEVTQTELDAKQSALSEGAFVDGDKTKLDGIESGADVTDTANVTAAGALMDSELTDLAGVKGVTISTLQPKPSEGAFADGDKTKLDGIESGATADQTASEIKTAYESNSDTNAFTDADHSKLDGIEASATANDTDANLKARANHTGTQTASTISDFDTEVANNSAVAANTAKVSNATHTGDATGSTALTVEKIQGRSVSSTAPSDGQVLKWVASASEWQPSADNTGSGGGGGGSGTVTSVAITGSDGIDVDSGSPITSSGTIALGLSNIPDAAISSASTWNAKQDAVTAGTGLSFTGNTLNAEVTQSELDAKPDVAGSSGQIQFNSSGNLGADSNLTWDDTNDRLGIGVSSPSEKLSVSSGNIVIDNGQAYRSKNTSGTTRSLLTLFTDNKLYVQSPSETVFQTNTDSSTVTAMTIDSSGDVGIGTTVPSEKLEIYQGNIKLGTDTNTTNKLIFERSGADRAEIYVGSGNQLQFDVGGSERVRIDSSGNVGVGTDSSGPSEKLHVNSGAFNTVALFESTDTEAAIQLKDTTGTASLKCRNDYRFCNDSGELARIDSSGNLGIGSTNPSGKLEVNTGSGIAYFTRTAGDDGSTSPALGIGADSTKCIIKGYGGLQIETAATGGSSAPRLNILETGEVGIGTTNPSFQLELVGTYPNSGLKITENASGSAACIRLQGNSSTLGGAIRCLNSSGGAGAFVIENGSSESMRIASTGRVTLKKSSNAEVTALTDGATITPDLDDANNFSVTLGGNRTLANPSNQTAGQSGVITITQDATGSRTLAFGSNWKFAGGTAPSLSTAANAVDVLAYYVESASRITAKLITDTK